MPNRFLEVVINPERRESFAERVRMMSGYKMRRAMVNRTVLGSDFECKNQEFTSQAIANRRFRRRKITPLMRWQFKVDMLRMMTNIRNMRPSIDNRPPETPSIIVMHRNRQQVEEGKFVCLQLPMFFFAL